MSQIGGEEGNFSAAAGGKAGMEIILSLRGPVVSGDLQLLFQSISGKAGTSSQARGDDGPEGQFQGDEGEGFAELVEWGEALPEKEGEEEDEGGQAQGPGG
jgi:hypothetical protein